MRHLQTRQQIRTWLGRACWRLYCCIHGLVCHYSSSLSYSLRILQLQHCRLLLLDVTLDPAADGFTSGQCCTGQDSGAGGWSKFSIRPIFKSRFDFTLHVLSTCYKDEASRVAWCYKTSTKEKKTSVCVEIWNANFRCDRVLFCQLQISSRFIKSDELVIRQQAVWCRFKEKASSGTAAAMLWTAEPAALERDESAVKFTEAWKVRLSDQKGRNFFKSTAQFGLIKIQTSSTNNLLSTSN